MNFARSLVWIGLIVMLAGGQAPSAEPRIVAHRGLLRHAPENTLANFRACLELRIGFEFDVQQTRDGHLVCIHDETVDRTTNGTGRVADLTLSHLRDLDAGSWFDPSFAGQRVPTVDAVFRVLQNYRNHDVLITVDVKAAGVGAEVARRARRHQVLPKLLFIGRTITDARLREQIRAAAPTAHTAAVANNAGEFAAALAAEHADWVYLRYLPSPQQIATVHARDMRAFIAGPTVSGAVPANWRRAAQAGVDGILTDYPLQLQHVLRERASRVGND